MKQNIYILIAICFLLIGCSQIVRKEIVTVNSPIVDSIGLGSIKGRIDLQNTDNNSLAVVALLGTNIVAFTDASGNYNIQMIPAATYNVVVAKEMYKNTLTNNVVVLPGEVTTINLISLYIDTSYNPQGPTGNTGPTGNPGEDGVDGQDGEDGSDGQDGQDGISLVWVGAFAEHPDQPQINWAYYNYDDGASYLWDGVTWNVLARDGEDGITGDSDASLGLEIQLPSYITLIGGESFSVYYNNIIKYSQEFRNGNYYIRAQRLNSNGSYSDDGGIAYPYKWEYTPGSSETSFNIEFRIYQTYTQQIVDRKVVQFKVADRSWSQYRNRDANIITLGDSICDNYLVPKYIYQFVNNDGTSNDLDMIGVNSTSLSGVKDDAWSGEGYWWFVNQADGYLRSDRPLSDANWDPGWGKDESYGWSDGDDYYDLSSTQRSHGRTRNQFWNPDSQRFDFEYYINTYHSSYVPSNQSGSHIDAVVSLAGFNDAIWKDTSYLIGSLDDRRDDIREMIDSIHDWDEDVVILLHLIPPQKEGDEYLGGSGSTFRSYEQAKYNQELWNEMILDNFDSSSMRSNKVYVLPTNAHFDSSKGLITETVNPDKFDSDYEEEIVVDIHPNEIGAKYYADSVYNALFYLVLD